MKILRETESLCPKCLKKIPAQLVEAPLEGDEGRVKIKKTCPSHGNFEDIYWGSAKHYKWIYQFKDDGQGINNPRTSRDKGCFFDCGLCEEHKSHTVLGIIDVTNRCNLKCPVCFSSANSSGKVYEPPLEQIKEMMRNLRNNEPVPAFSFQFSGGEPTLRDDLHRLIKIGKELGFLYIMVDTNGIRIAKDMKYLKQLKDAGLDAFYLQFDGLDDYTYKKTRNAPLLDTKIQAIENCRKIGVNVVLVVTLIRGINDSQIGGIIKFAIKNHDIITCVNFQPISFSGNASKLEIEKNRITNYDFINLVEKQTNGKIKVEYFYPCPSLDSISKFIEAKAGESCTTISTHPFCGLGTYVVINEDGTYTPINELVEVDNLLKALDKGVEELKNEGLLSKKLGISKLKLRARLLKGVIKTISDPTRRDLVLDVLKNGTFESAVSWHKNALMIGCMHFMDPWNFDFERIQRCTIHYSTPDGKLIPFCSYNNFHRSRIEVKFSVPVEEWEKKNR